MKKREWDKDVFDYNKAKDWLGKNHLPVIFFFALLAIPILFMAVRYAVTHFPAISDTTIANEISKKSIDFVTPALYYFSSIAQTMGAIIGLALAAMYAIMPNIRSSKDNPAFEPARRLLQRDEYFRRSINFGSVCILVSIIGLLFIYVTASSQSWAFILLLFLGVTALGLGVYSLGTMFYFIRVRMPKYFSPVEILEFAFEKNYDIVSNCSKESKLDFVELCLLSESNSITNHNTVRSFNIISSLDSSDINLICKTNIPLLLEKLKKDLLVSGITDDTFYLSKCFCSLINSTFKYYVEHYCKEPRKENEILTDIIKIYRDVFWLIFVFSNTKSSKYIFDYLNKNLYVEKYIHLSTYNSLLKIQLECITKNQEIINIDYKEVIFNNFDSPKIPFFDGIRGQISEKDFLNGSNFKDTVYGIYSNYYLILLLLISNNIKNMMQLYQNNISPSWDLIMNFVFLKTYLENISKDRNNITKITGLPMRDFEFQFYTAFLLNLDLNYFFKYSSLSDPKQELNKLLRRINYNYLYLIYYELNLKHFKGNLYSFIYDVFIPYLKPFVNTDNYANIFRKVLREQRNKK